MNKNIYSVTQVNNYIKLLLEDDVLLNGIYIEGEVSNFKAHGSGHLYFSIKDTECSVNVIMYKQDAENLNISIENGMKVVCFGKISSYPKTGQYQFYAKEIEAEGKGDVFLDFEKLKEKLFKEGLFDEEYKKEIPKMPSVIGVITSETGAAIRDILKVAKRRNPSAKIILIPALVQGNDAPDSIVYAINMAREFKKLDVLILARGGGSKEDLWCFNDEKVARAIFTLETPIITGIGHEIDYTIADFVSDMRASTPSAAIEVCLPEAYSLKENIYNNIYRQKGILEKKLSENKRDFYYFIQKNSFKNFLDIVKLKRAYLQTQTDNVNRKINEKIKENTYILQNNINKMESSSPVNILKNGYALITNEKNNPIKTKQGLKNGDRVNISFQDGDIKAQIIE